ncbi:MAG: PorP/SprF family type IX secretion system membrane protein [Bacteroidia bacterium]
MTRHLLITFIISASCLTAWAQDPHFTQYYSAPVYLNPAFAGYEGCSRISTSYRMQWPDISGNYQTLNFSYDQFVKPIAGSIAVNYQYDRAGEGTLQTHSAMLTYSPAFRLFNKKLVISPAIEAGWRQKYIDWSKLTFGDQIDPRYGFIYNTNEINENDSKGFFDMNAGLLITHGNFVYGAAFHHLTQPDEGFIGSSKLPLKITAHALYVGQVNEHFKISPSLFYQQQQDFQSMVPTLSFYVYGVKAGVGTRFNFFNADALLFMLGYKGKWFSAGYSYDYTVSKLSNATGGSHELSFIARFNCKNKAEKRKGVELVNF